MLIQILLLSFHSMGGISLYNGAYQRTDADLPFFKRYYSSRRLERGLFGLGWCHNLDNELMIENQVVTLKDCKLPIPVEYIRGKNPSTLLKASGFPDQLKATNKGWERWQKGVLLETYNKTGRLTSYRESGILWQVRTVKDSIIIQDPKKGRTLTLKRQSASGFIGNLSTPGYPSHFYDYDQGILVGVRTNEKRNYSYMTSSSGDILMAMDGSTATETVRYDEQFDRVAQVETASGCRFVVHYQGSNAPQVDRSCPSLLAKNHEGLPSL